MRLYLDIFAVEALAASWIEMAVAIRSQTGTSVEALAASWIEIFCSNRKVCLDKSRSPCGFVD